MKEYKYAQSSKIGSEKINIELINTFPDPDKIISSNESIIISQDIDFNQDYSGSNLREK